MVLWSLMTCQNPFNDLLSTPLKIHVAVCKGKRGSDIFVDVPSYGSLNGIMEECWDKDPLRRPTLPEIVVRQYPWYLPLF